MPNILINVDPDLLARIDARLARERTAHRAVVETLAPRPRPFVLKYTRDERAHATKLLKGRDGDKAARTYLDKIAATKRAAHVKAVADAHEAFVADAARRRKPSRQALITHLLTLGVAEAEDRAAQQRPGVTLLFDARVVDARGRPLVSKGKTTAPSAAVKKKRKKPVSSPPRAVRSRAEASTSVVAGAAVPPATAGASYTDKS